MSAVLTSLSTTSPGAPQASVDSPHMVSIMSPAVARAVVAELMLKPEKLPAAMRVALAQTDGDASVVAALERMTVWADLSALVVSALHAEERQRRKASLTYCVMRQAHFGLLSQLFKVSRNEVRQMRQQLGISGETRPRIIADSELPGIHESWRRVCTEFTQCDADRWISLAEQFPQHGLNSLYQVIVKDGRDGAG